MHLENSKFSDDLIAPLTPSTFHRSEIKPGYAPKYLESRKGSEG